MMDYSKAQMSSLSEAAGSVGCPRSSNAGVKLEAVMEQLQKQHGAKLEMNLQEKHLLHAQLMFAQQAAAARASDSRGEQTYEAARRALNGHIGRMDEDEEDEDSDEEEQEMARPEENEEVEEGVGPGPRQQGKKPGFRQVVGFPLTLYSTARSSAEKQMSESPPSAIKQAEEEKALLSPAGKPSFTSPNGSADWGYDEPLKQRGNGMWAEENEGGKIRGEPSRDFAKLYELDNDLQRKEFLDDLFVFMQKRGTPVNRIPIMAKQVLDLYKLYKLVTEKGGLVEVINKKIWREITKGLNLPTSITSAAFTLRTQYMKYLYPFECEKKGLSSPGELQAAIDSNRREGRRPSYTNSLYRYSPSPSSAPLALLSPPAMPTPPTGHNGLSSSAPANLKRNTDEMSTPVLPCRQPGALSLRRRQQQQQQQQQLAQAVTLEQFRERLERGAAGAAANGPEKKMMRMAEEQQRLMQQALQQNLLALASQFNPMSLKLNNEHESKPDLSRSASTNGAASISVSVEVNGTVYSGMLFAQKSAAPTGSQNVTMAGTNGFSAMSSSHSPSSSSSSSSSKGPH
ncbi:AT-rich interactive domain-containing protein 3B-like [Spinachia spinachia]